MTGGEYSPYVVRDDGTGDKWSMNFAAAPFKDKNLDCIGKDSGNSACWPAAVNIAVPIACIVVFIVVLTILYVTSPKPKALTDSYISSSSSLHTKSTTINMPRKTAASYQNTGLSTDTLRTTIDTQHPTLVDSVSIRVQQDPSLTTQL